MKIEKIVVFILLILLIPLSSTYGGEQDHSVKKILLSEEAEWSPFTYEKGGKPTKGLSLEVMTLIFSRLNIEIDFKLYPMNRCIKQMRDGRRDAITMISESPDRERFSSLQTLSLPGKDGSGIFLTDRIKLNGYSLQT